MRRKRLYLFFVLTTAMLVYHNDVTARAIPREGIIIEQRTLPAEPNRALVLWMINPERSDPIPENEPYTCPDETRGNSYSGPTRVSLIDVSDNRLINTIKISDPHFPRRDGFVLPYEIRPGYYYLVDSVGTRKASKPTILNFQDLNGDGEAAEFVLYDAPFCMGLQTTLIGYSRQQDRVIQYPFEIKYRRGKEAWTEKSLWLEYIFSEKPLTPGHYSFDVDYRGRGGSLTSYVVSYDQSSERFRGTCTLTDQ